MSEPLLAAGIGANVWLLASVSAHVSPQIEIQGESLIANLTFVGLNSSMYELMSFKL